MDTSDRSLTPLAVTVSRPERVFPTLTPAQIARIAPHGRQRAIAPGDVLVEVGQRPVPFFVVLSGEMQVLRPSAGTEALIVAHRAGQFTGEGTMLTGRRAIARTRVSEPGEVIELDREQLLGLIQTDTELSDIFMRAFVLRRIELIAGGYGDVVLIGSTHCAGTLRVKEFLTRNGHPFEGAGIYYAASRMESQLCLGEEIVIVGGGNSAGQAAVFLAETAKHVHLLVRTDGLADTMSRYLVRRVEAHPAITLRTRTELVALDGDRHLDRVQWRHSETGVVEAHDIRHVFMMTGAVPNTGWLDGCVALDRRGFIKTGQDLSQDELWAAGWPLARPPYLLETSRPDVFAVGDVRGGNLKRVASAVGEGSIAVAFVHQVQHQ
jgi:thioredoxin reductase